MRATDLLKVRDLDLFSSMDDANFERMMQAAYLQTFPAQIDLIVEGEAADFLHVLVEGCVELYARSNGRESTMSMLSPVRTFILAAIINDAEYLMSARTYERSLILMLPAEDVREAFKRDASFARSIVVELAAGYRMLVKAYKDVKLRTSVERLANCLLRYHELQGSSGVFELPYDKRKLASLLSMTPENLSRAFNSLKRYGVDVDGPTIRLNDVDSLVRLAQPNPLIDNQFS